MKAMRPLPLSPLRTARIGVAIVLLGHALAAAEPAPKQPEPGALNTSTNKPTPVSVPANDPLMRKSAAESLQELTRRNATVTWDRGGDERIQARLASSLEARSVEQNGSVIRHLRSEPSVRGVFQLFDPFAPLPRVTLPPASAYETQVPLDHGLPGSLRSAGTPPLPRAFIDPIRHEYGIGLW